MLVLSFDTADAYCTLVLSEDGKLLGKTAVEAGREQAKILAPLTEEFLKSHRLQVGDLDRLAICTGPGSFTGLRIGLAFTRGLAMAAQKPLLGFDHFVCTQHAFQRSLIPLPPGENDPYDKAIPFRHARESGHPSQGMSKCHHREMGPGVRRGDGLYDSPPGGRRERSLLIIRDSGRDELFAHLDQPFLATAVQLTEILNKNADMLFTGNGAGIMSNAAPHLAPRRIDLPREEIVLSAALLAAQAARLPHAMPEPLYLREADVTYQRA